MRAWLTAADLSALHTSLQLAFITTVALLLLSTPLAWWLATGRSRLRGALEILATLPLVLPPTVLGFYLLSFLGPNGWAGQVAIATTGTPLAFTFTGMVVGSCIYSLPFAVQPLHSAFRATAPEAMEAAATLRASPWDAFVHVALPLARHGYFSAALLVFAHTLGEFGVILMIGGNIPGSTRVASIALFNHVESLDYRSAHALSVTLLAICVALLLLLQWVRRAGGKTLSTA